MYVTSHTDVYGRMGAQQTIELGALIDICVAYRAEVSHYTTEMQWDEHMEFLLRRPARIV